MYKRQGPITLLLEKKEIIPDLVTSGSPFVAIRIPSHTMTRQLLQKCDFPLAAPSANPFGYISPTTAQHVEDQLGDKIPVSYTHLDVYKRQEYGKPNNSNQGATTLSIYLQSFKAK